jgi:hypothetical protein
MRKLKPNATFEDVQQYIEQLQKKTYRILQRDEMCSWLRGPYYALEEEALVMSKSLTDGYARICLVMGVIQDMAGSGMMCNMDFCYDGYTVFHYLRDGLCALAYQIQDGTLTVSKEQFDLVVKDLQTCIRNNHYVTGNADQNFCAQDLGDWEGLINTFKIECSRKPSKHELVSREVDKKAKIVAATEQDLANKVNEEALALKKYESAKKKTAAATRKVAKMKKQHQECVEKRQSLKLPPAGTGNPSPSTSLSNFGPPAVRVRVRLGMGKRKF